MTIELNVFFGLGANCLKGGNSVDEILKTLSSECLQPDILTTQFTESQLPVSSDRTFTQAQLWATIHSKCISRLLMLSKRLIGLPVSLDVQAEDTNFSFRLSFSQRIFRLIGQLAREISRDAFDDELLSAIRCCAETVPTLFRLKIDCVNYDSNTTNNFGSLALLVLEEFLQVTQVIFLDGHVFQNIRSCVLASILDILDSEIWRYDGSKSSPRPPLVYWPQIVLYILKLLKEAKHWASHVNDWKEVSDYCCSSGISGFTYQIHSEKFVLLQRCTFGEYLRLLFPPTKQWLDNLVHLSFFLYCEGVKLKPRVDRSRQNSTKTSTISESDGSIGHEDEAIFGNLFSESGRSVGLSEGLDQPTTAIPGASSSHFLLTQVAVEVLGFLKDNIFSPEWHSAVYDDACKKIGDEHINFLLRMLSSQASLPDEKNSESCPTSSSQRMLVQVSEICFELLHKLLVRHVLPATLKVHLADQVLKLENGKYVYNMYTLTLLCHALISRVEVDDSHLPRKIFEGYVDSVLEKAKVICCNCPESNDFFGTLPCALYLEIVLMAFHLSNEGGKISLANYVFSSLRKMDALKAGFSGRQLFCWSLIVSRLVLVLRHMVSYPSGCPSWLLLRLKSRLRDTLSKTSLTINDSLLSWTSTAAKSILGDSIREVGNVCVLLPQLIDSIPHPLAVNKHGGAFHALGLEFGDLISTFSWILSFWRGKIAETVEQLILERYIFLLCWGTITSVSPKGSHMFPYGSTLSGIDLSNMEFFFHFGLLVLSNNSMVGEGVDLSNIVLHLLRQLQTEQLSDKIAVQGCDFSRQAAWLSLVLSLLHAGIWKYSERHEVPEVEQSWIQWSKEKELFGIAEGTVASMLEGNDSELLLSSLSSLLMMYMQVLQGAFLSLVDRNRYYPDGLSPLLLLKHNAFDENKQGFLLEKCGSSPSQLESIYGLLLKLDEVIAKEDSGTVNGVFLRCLLHGFPSHSDLSSGTLVSCILAVRELVSTLAGYLKVQAAVGRLSVPTDLRCQLLDTVMAIRSDKIFQFIHKKCETICSSLISHERELGGFSDFYVLKQIEGLLAGINDPETQEMLLSTFVDIMDGLRRDDSKADVCQFYLGSEACESEEVEKIFCRERGDILTLIEALEKCYSETVNLKVLNLLVDLLAIGLCPGLKEKLQNKLLGMDLSHLSRWLEIRLLGCTTKSSEGVITAKGSSTALRERTMELLAHLVSQSCEKASTELHNRLVQAMLMSLDGAFTLYDIHSAKAYFSFVVKLLNEESSMKLLVEKSVILMASLVGDEGLLPGLKFLLGFLSAVLGDCGANKNSQERFPSKHSSDDGSGTGTIISKPVGSRKNSENLILPANTESSAASMDCDATSADEDEDDGTSDGELGSVDKDEEDDSNSERALASKVCTFTSSGSNFMEQHWYFCYTCDLTVSKGCCSICAKVCHRGHRVVYSRSSRFFCDCGAGGVRGSSCQCLKPRKFTGSNNMPTPSTNNFQPFLPLPENSVQTVDSDSDLDDDFCSVDMDNSFKLSIPREVQDGLPVMLENLNMEDQVLELCNRLLPMVIGRREANLSKDKKVLLGDDKILSYNADLFQLRKAYKSGSLDLKIKADYPNARELKSHLSTGSLTKSLLSISVRGRLAAGEGDKVAIFDVGQLIGQPTVAPVTADKTSIKPLSKNIVRFEIVNLLFNPVTENYLAVSGYEECQVLTVNPRGEVTDRLAIELALQGAYIRKVEWVPGSQVQLMVVTNMFVKVYDLSQDNISPMHYFTLTDDLIIDATLVPASMGKVFLLVLSESGRLFRLQVSMEGDVGAKALTEIIQVQDNKVQAKGLSLHFSATYRLLFLSYQDGTTLLGHLDANAAVLTETSVVYEDDKDIKVKPGLHHWKELLPGSGVFACFSSLKANSALAVSLGPHEVFAQNMRYGAGSALPVVGIAAYRPLSKDKTHSLVLHDDGSLQIYSLIPFGSDHAASVNTDQVKKIGSSILNNRVYAGSNPEFPLDFFEKTTCITSDVKLSCDALKNSDSDSIKQRLTSDDGFLESPSVAGFKVRSSLIKGVQAHS